MGKLSRVWKGFVGKVRGLIYKCIYLLRDLGSVGLGVWQIASTAIFTVSLPVHCIRRSYLYLCALH